MKRAVVPKVPFEGTDEKKTRAPPTCSACGPIANHKNIAGHITAMKHLHSVAANGSWCVVIVKRFRLLLIGTRNQLVAELGSLVDGRFPASDYTNEQRGKLKAAELKEYPQRAWWEYKDAYQQAMFCPGLYH